LGAKSASTDAQISGPNLQENQKIEACKEEGRAVSTQETAAWRKWEMEHMARIHPRLVNRFAGGN
jgi:hypothetical protein